DARQQLDAVAGGRLVILFFAVAQPGDFRVAHGRFEKLGKDFRIPLAKRGREIGTGERPAEFTAKADPGCKVQLRGVNQGAVDIPNSRPICYIHCRCSLCKSFRWPNRELSGWTMRPNSGTIPVSTDDQQLIAECLQGQSAAFGELVRRYQDRVYNTV